ncbi:hypothetical protein FDP41_003504 [Naegleria fowleri]|uniref:Uncharacterized protein n=1 Tax=Naegleria fowleri TaxID=5763 RepID=A0A6A5BS46_NAEFO|nr:uncharacterized protein FDP41_003504 [Naegleria fowleri]KAF0977512.1 hypothetical protein FDP41_003504 [Naegleria fowleri]
MFRPDQLGLFHLSERNHEASLQEQASSPSNKSVLSFKQQDLKESNHFQIACNRERNNMDEDDDVLSSTTFQLDDDLDETMKSFLSCQCKACKELSSHQRPLGNKDELIEEPSHDLNGAPSGLEDHLKVISDESPHSPMKDNSFYPSSRYYSCVLEEDMTREEKERRNQERFCCSMLTDSYDKHLEEEFKQEDIQENKIESVLKDERCAKVLLLQTLARCTLVMKHFSFERNQIQRFQAVIRQFLECNMFELSRNALRRIQAICRGNSLRVHFHCVISIIPLIQALMRALTVRRRMNMVKRHGERILALTRGVLTRKMTNRLVLLSLQSSSDLIRSVQTSSMKSNDDLTSESHSDRNVMSEKKEEGNDSNNNNYYYFSTSNNYSFTDVFISYQEPTLSSLKGTDVPEITTKNSTTTIMIPKETRIAKKKERLTVFPPQRSSILEKNLKSKRTMTSKEKDDRSPCAEPSLSSEVTKIRNVSTLSGALLMIRNDISRRNDEFYDEHLLMSEKDLLKGEEEEFEENSNHESSKDEDIPSSKVSQEEHFVHTSSHLIMSEQEMEELFSRREQIQEMEKQIQELRQQERSLKERSKVKIDLLHKYNKIKDVGQFLIDKLSTVENRIVASIYEEYNLESEDIQ